MYGIAEITAARYFFLLILSTFFKISVNGYGAGSCSVLRNSPGTTDGNYWALITDSHGNIYTSTNIAPASNYTEVSVEGNIVFGAATSNYSSVYLISSDGLTYVEFRFNVAGNWGDCQVVMRTDGAQLFVSDVVSTSTMMTDEQWYRFKCVWKYDNSYEIWINNGGSTELELALYAKDEYETSYPGLADFERVRLYVRGSPYGYDEIVVEGKYSPFCGGPGTIYSENDTNLDCYVNLADYAILASYWLECSDPNKIECKDIFY